jgi:hypothetical protein
MEFCANWNERARSDYSNPLDACEFEQYSDLLSSGKWYMVTPEGVQNRIIDAPVFFSGDEVSWRLEEGCPGQADLDCRNDGGLFSTERLSGRDLNSDRDQLDS